MPLLNSSFYVTGNELERFGNPRHGVVEERCESPGRYTQLSGPFVKYERTFDTVDLGNGIYRVNERVDYRLVMPYVGWIVTRPLRRVLKPRVPNAGAPTKPPWWTPRGQIDAHGINVLGLLCGASVVAGYLNTLITQTIVFASTEFGTSARRESVALAIVRVGILVSLAMSTYADRHGRRSTILLCLAAGPFFAALGALSPNLTVLTVTQLLSRSFALGLGILIPIVAAEEMPKDSRAFAISITSLVTAFGAGMCVMTLRLADLGIRAWRLVYLVPLLSVFILIHLKRTLPESRRFLAHRDDRDDQPIADRPRLRQHMGRLVMLCVGLALLNVFVAPASQLQNRYLKKERGYSGGGITLFTLCTNTPGGIGVAIGGKLADARGRRVVGAVAVAALGIFTTASFFASGPWLWLWAALGAIIGSATIPSLSVYLPELFPTALRGKANGVISTVAVMGSAVGLITVGILADRWGRVGPGLALMCVGPLLVAALVLLKFPETAHMELEDLNPQDVLPSP